MTVRSYAAQIWADQELVSQIDSLSLDAAREVCRAAPMAGHCGRVWCNEEDYVEVYPATGEPRFGKFANVTLVRVAVALR